jgi:hypothetical protein
MDTAVQKFHFGTISIHRWPLVEIRIEGSPKDDEDLENFLNAIVDLYRYKQSFVILTDLSRAGWFSMHQLGRIAECMRVMQPYSRQYLHSLGVLITNAMVRNLFDLFKKIKPPVVPWHTLHSKEQAEEFAKQYVR